MESMSPECTPLKTAYDTCFQNWYTTKFLKHAEERADTSRRQDKNASSNASASANTASASSTDNNTHTDMGMDECDELFKAYKGCVMKAVKEREIDDLLADARKETPFETYGDQKA